MDLITVREVRSPASRDDLRVDVGQSFLGGGSWLFSEPQLELTALVDLTRLGWEPIVETDVGLSVAATCTFADLAAWADGARERSGEWPAVGLFRPSCEALLGSFKVWNVATVGGNICLALPAGPMTSLMAGLDATAVVWTPDGGERELPVAELVTGVQSTSLKHGEVLRSIEIPARTLRSRAGIRKLALSPLGRSGTLVIARVDDDGAFVVTITAAVRRPVQLRFVGIPYASDLADAVRGTDDWYDDAHGAPDWREAMSALLAEQLREELS